MFSVIVRDMFALTNTAVIQQGMRTASENLTLSIFRSFSQSPKTYESDHEFIVTPNSSVSGYKILRVRGEVWRKCRLLANSVPSNYVEGASDICKYSIRQDMIESAQEMKANAIVGFRSRSYKEWRHPTDDLYVVSECWGDAVTLIKDEN